MSPVLADVRTMIDAGTVELITSDVFDTLVWRPVARPADLWVVLGESLRDEGLLPQHVTPGVFAGARVAAEERARERIDDGGVAECTLEEIWEEMPATWRAANAADWAPYRARELSIERAALRPLPDAPAVLRHARQAGVQVQLVSDTYLSGDQVRDLLVAAGVEVAADGEVEILTSSEHRRGKYHGLLRTALERSGVDPSRAVHLGDHPVADVETARALGMQAVHLDVSGNRLVVGSARHPIERYSARHGDDGGVTAACRTALVRADQPDDPPDAAHQFGVAVAGPLLAGFAHWASVTTERLGATTVHCLLREGAMIADLMRTVRPDGPTPRTVHASRWVMMRAAVVEGTADEIAPALARRARFEPRHVAEAFGCDVELVASVVGPGPIPHERRLEVFESIAAHDELRAGILDGSARLRERLLRYLDEALAPGDGPLVLCDIGWGGTIQEGIERVLRADGRDVEVVGLYAMLSSAGIDRVHGGSRMLGYVPASGPAGVAERPAAVLARNPEIVEQIATPALGTLTDIDERGRPVTTPGTAPPPSLQRAQDGVRAFAATLAELWATTTDQRRTARWVDDDEFTVALLEMLTSELRAPDPRVADVLGAWPHDDVAGTDIELLADASTTVPVRFVNAADARDIRMEELFWLPGLAARVNPELAAQLEATALGVDPEVLCPPNELGRGRIALFPIGSLVATAGIEPVPHVSAQGWSLLRLRGSVDSLRSVRVDFGERPGLVQVGLLRIVIHVGDEHRQLVFDDLRDPRLTLVDAVALGPDLLAQRAGGHLLFDPDPELAGDCRLAEVDVAYRGWATGEHLATPAVHDRAIRGARRAWRSAGRRLRSLVRRPG